MIANKKTYITKLVKSDLSSVLPLMRELHQIHSKTQFDHEWKRTWVCDFIQNNNGIVYVAKHHDIIGYIIGEYRHEEYTLQKVGYIREIFVTKNMRRKHIGNRLLSTITRHFKKVGCSVIKLHVFTNSNSIAFYNAIGAFPSRVEYTKIL